MNKLMVGMLSSLATVGLGAGGMLVALSTPSVKSNLNVSFGEKNIVGTEKVKVVTETEYVEIPFTESDFTEELNRRGYSMIEYVRGENTDVVLTQNGSVLDYTNNPTAENKQFIGWSSTEDGSNMVCQANGSTKLYPVFTEIKNGTIKVVNMHNVLSRRTISNSLIDMWGETNIIGDYMGQSHTMDVIGLSSTKDTITLVGSIEPNKTYYYVYNVDGKYALSTDEANAKYYEWVFGVNYNTKVNIRTINNDYTDVYLRQENLNNINMNMVYIFDEPYEIMGYSTDADSIEMLNIIATAVEEDSDIFAVYRNIETGEIMSYTDVINLNVEYENMSVITINGCYTGYGGKFRSLENLENKISMFGIRTISVDTDCYEYVGLAINNITVNTIDFSEFGNQDCYFIVYRNMTTGELVNSCNMNNVVNTIGYGFNEYHYKNNLSSITSFNLGGTTYPIVGWSNMSSSNIPMTQEEIQNYNGVVFAITNIDGTNYSYAGFVDYYNNNPSFIVHTVLNGTTGGVRDLSAYQSDLIINNESYIFMGWTNDPNSYSSIVGFESMCCSDAYPVYMWERTGTNMTYLQMQDLAVMYDLI